ncbi:MAG: transposase family protein [Pseudanabaenaceae cyanobacterium bins.68]|nr:transposase family protein [Pseudanabaenaceae cyanobacterium bins.68]
MLNTEGILKQERLMRAITGLNLKAFRALEESFEQIYQQSLIKPEQKRKRRLGGGRKATLRSTTDKLIYILMYIKCYPTFDLIGVLFNFDRSCAHDWVHRLLPVLEVTLGKKQALPERKINSVAEFLERFPDIKEVAMAETSTNTSFYFPTGLIHLLQVDVRYHHIQKSESIRCREYLGKSLIKSKKYQ